LSGCENGYQEFATDSTSYAVVVSGAFLYWAQYTGGDRLTHGCQGEFAVQHVHDLIMEHYAGYLLRPLAFEAEVIVNEVVVVKTLRSVGTQSRVACVSVVRGQRHATA
jgi:hypothetical protein